MAKKKKIIVPIVIAIIAAILAAVILATGLFIWLIRGKGGYDEYKNVSSTVSTVLPANPINFKAAQADNKDVCGWIQVPGIDVIDYPIMQSDAETDDNFYLDHDSNGNYRDYGSIYIQKLNHNDFSDPNTLIYGHDMLNGSMFGELRKFRDKEFFDSHREIYIYTPGHILKYEIISAFVYDNRHIMNSFNFSDPDERQEFFDTCVNPTSFTKNVIEGAELKSDDKIITLSTCTGDPSQRYLVVGRLVSDTKTAE